MDDRNVPPLLKSISGMPIETVSDWKWIRREEILALFSHFVYGVRPVNRPVDLQFEVVWEKEVVPGIKRREVRASFRDYSFLFSVYLPAEYNGRVPMFIYLQLQGQETVMDLERSLDNPIVPFEDIIGRGYGIAVVRTTQIYPDEMYDVNFDFASRVDYRKGIFTALERREERTSASWATISAWAWAMSRVADYLETDADCDGKKLIAVGHSRGGKTALWCGATDKRMALTISSCSGCSGAAISREKIGERIASINSTDWFCRNYHRFNGKEAYLPVDQHMLLALMAPRAVYVSSAEEDSWADPDSEFLACRLANEVYDLYGMQGFVTEDETPVLKRCTTKVKSATICMREHTGCVWRTGPAIWTLRINFFADNHEPPAHSLRLYAGGCFKAWENGS